MVFLDRLGTHAMFFFMGSIVISATPKRVQFITGYIFGWIIYFLLLRIMSIARPIVQRRLEDTARLKADLSHTWVPPVGQLPSPPPGSFGIPPPVLR